MANFLLKAGTCSMETIKRTPNTRLNKAARSVLAVALIAFSCVTLTAAQKGKASSNRAKQQRSETMPISANYPASRTL